MQSINRPAVKTELLTDKYDRYDYYFASYEGLEDLKQKGIQAINECVQQGGNAFTRGWGDINGSSASFSRSEVKTNDRNEANKQEWVEYINRQSLENAINSFDEFLTTVDMGGAFKKSRLIITDDTRGIFDFSLASQGLYRLPEFYSEELKKENPFEFFQELPGVVPPDFVRKNQLEQFWYDSKDLNKSFLLERRQKGTTLMLDTNPNAKIETDNTGMIFTDPIEYKGARLEFATTNKKSYVMFERKGGKAKMVDLYVGIGGLAGLTYEGMLARAMPLFLCARYFESVGIRTRICGARMYYSGAESFCLTYPIKEYGQDLDFNYIAMNVADPRWFRWNLWKYTSALSVKGELGGNSIGWGSTIYGGDLMYETFNRYKNWYTQEMIKGNKPQLPIDRNLMLVGGLPTPTNSSLTDRDGIAKEFYRILDIVDFQFNKPDKAAERIYNRMKQENPYVSKDEVRKYIFKIMATANSFPQDGDYATEPERIKELEDKYDEVVDGVNTFLNTII